MKNYRRVLALVLVVCMCLSYLTFASAEEHTHTSRNQLIWSFDESDGYLTISGTGTVAPIGSADEQPWAEFREQITYVCIDPYAEFFVEDIAYWFDGCTNLVYAEVPGYWLTIGHRAFADCVNLQEIVFASHGVIDIAEDSFVAETAADLIVMVYGQEPYDQVLGANWHGRTVEVLDLSDMTTYRCMGDCYCSSCTWRYEYDQRDEDYHWEYAQCNNCSANEYAYGSKRAHTFSGNTCTVCGYTKSSSGGGSSGGGTTTCYHTRTYLEWSDCDWYEFCYYCDEFLDYGTTHGTYIYGSWSYYSTSQHRRTYTCLDCGEGSYEYGSHSTTNKYASYSASQHSVTKYCSTCASNVGSATYTSHSLSYGSWSSYSATQHRRTVSCATCGYSTYGYGDHADSNSDGSCDTCGYTMSVTVTWNAGNNGGTVNGSSSITTSVTVGATATAPSYTPVKTGYSFNGWYTASKGGSLYSSVKVSAATTFYAQFSAKTYVITWDLGNGSKVTTNQTYGQTVAVPADPSLTGYSFAGWYTSATGGTKITSSSVFTGTSNVTYYARFSANTYAITWDMGDGTTKNTNQSYGAKLELPDEPSKIGHSFVGWYTAPNAGSKVDASTVFAGTTATTYYARFSAQTYEITWDMGDGMTETTDQIYGQPLVLPTEPTKDSYVFDGWFTDPDVGTEVNENIIYTGTGNTTYYAHWIQVFSVTVPVSLPLCVSQTGIVYAADDAEILNHSSAPVVVTGVTLTAQNGWSLVPYATDMAGEKVDAKLVGFRINDLQTDRTGNWLEFDLSDPWEIAKEDALTLHYDAVISAMSSAVKEETIMSIVFILEWA